MTWFQIVRLLHYYGYSHVVPRRRLTLGPGATIAPNVSLRNGERIVIGARLEGGRARLSVGRRLGRADHDRRELPARAGGLRDRFRLRPHARSEHRRAGARRARHHDRRRRLARRPRLRRHRRHDRRRLRRQRELGRHARPARRRDRGRGAGTRRAPARGLRAGRGRCGRRSGPRSSREATARWPRSRPSPRRAEPSTSRSSSSPTGAATRRATAWPRSPRSRPASRSR